MTGGTWSKWIRDEALRALDGAGCAVCRRAGETDDRFAFRFTTELYGHPHIVEQVTAARGFCPEHTRLLLAGRAARWVMRYVYAEVVPGAARRLEPGRRERPATCYACRNRAEVEEGLIWTLLVALGEEDVAAAYHASGGVCYRHLVRALQRASPEQAGIVAEVFTGRASGATEPDLWFHLLAGLDRDASVRHRLGNCAFAPRTASPRESDRAPPALERLWVRLGLPVCPSCFAGGLTEWQYLEWLAGEYRDHPEGLAVEAPWLCAHHLHDLALHDPEPARWVASLAWPTVADRIARFRVALGGLPAATLAGRLTAARADLGRATWSKPRAWLPAVLQATGHLVRTRKGVLSEALGSFANPARCGACHAGMTAEQRETALVVAALADGATARHYEASHGLCLRHVDELSAAQGAIPRQVALARLRVFLWELEEAGRKCTWQYRYEPLTGEASAWYRVAGLLDGQSFLGGAPLNLNSE